MNELERIRNVEINIVRVCFVGACLAISVVTYIAELYVSDDAAMRITRPALEDRMNATKNIVPSAPCLVK
jgi:hypothetical protein